MIRVTINRTSDGSLESFRVKGHALYDEPGKDIVCAGVSAVTVGTVNAVEALLGITLQVDTKHGMLDVRIPDNLDQVLNEKVQLLLNAMTVMLHSIEQSYGEYIAIHNKTKKS
ncbi:ribosomal-processing cysteine protease Prp [Paenibacillus xerothermodurans]|uniref:Ribosomal processing cysteine protease Prp n=1 Tax=Paenibacillus xerothermodurans TaxID=1977292 RepID=A0A2W1N8L0_PAEXE|nr:ribosomal-processing cysteine protease Prp [Paenibacillus xerothermodurans]PZE19980.1 ribosomal-processing cysteine protease Prp [Paenibacillus xerothermodurans]